MKEIGKRTIRVLRFMVAITVIAPAVAIIGGFTASPAHASPGAPNLGNFAPSGLYCIGQSGPIPAVRMTGIWQGRQEAVIGITTERGRPPLIADGVFVVVNGQALSRIPDKNILPERKPGLYYMTVPAWDGIPGHEPVISISVNNPQLDQPVFMNMKWREGVWFDRLATGWANEPLCQLTDGSRPS